MADNTASYAQSGVQPKTVHAGANVVRARYTADQSHSATDVIQMVKIPRDAIIDDVVLCPAVGVGSQPAALTVQVGDGGDPNRYLSASFSSTALLRATSGLGYKYDISDDAAVAYDTIDVTVDAGALTVSHAFDLIVTYHMDEAV